VKNNDQISRRAAITAQQFCSFRLGGNLSGCNGINKTGGVEEVRV